MTIYTTQSISGYNSNPPSDDGSQTSDNEITWSKHKEKLGDPVKTLAEGINTAVVAAFAKVFLASSSTITTNTTLGASQHGKAIRVTNGPTLSITAAATLGDGWNCIVFNMDGNSITIDPNGAETINGASTLTIDSQYDYAFISCDGTNFVAGYNDIFTVTGLTAKTSLTGADQLALADSAASNVNKKITWTNFLVQLQSDLLASTSAVGMVEKATAAEMAAETADKYPDAALVRSSPGVAKVWVDVDMTGTAALDNSYNMTSIADNGTGDVTLTFDTDFANANWCAVGMTSYNAGNDPGVVTVTSRATGSGQFVTVDVHNAEDPRDYDPVMIAIFGD